MRDCLYTEKELKGKHEPPPEAVVVEGVVNTFGLHPERLEAHRDEIVEMVGELPTEFLDIGGGWSFLNLPIRKDDSQWGEQSDAEALFVLAAGLGLAEVQLPRSMWHSLPGGVPYVIFHL
jgi:hypothetical protein